MTFHSNSTQDIDIWNMTLSKMTLNTATLSNMTIIIMPLSMIAFTTTAFSIATCSVTKLCTPYNDTALWHSLQRHSITTHLIMIIVLETLSITIKTGALSVTAPSKTIKNVLSTTSY